MTENPYHAISYNSRARWATYFLQWRTLADVLPAGAQVLEIGVGSGAVAEQLRRCGFKVVTLDKDARVHPDVVGDIVNLPFENSSFDGVLAAEILEHMPFDDSLKALRELLRVAKTYVLVSVPDRRPIVFSARFKIPFFREKKILIKFPLTRKKLSSKEHVWEIGYAGFQRGYVRRAFESAGGRIEREFASVDAPQIRFFLLAPKEKE